MTPTIASGPTLDILSPVLSAGAPSQSQSCQRPSQEDSLKQSPTSRGKVLCLKNQWLEKCRFPARVNSETHNNPQPSSVLMSTSEAADQPAAHPSTSVTDLSRCENKTTMAAGVQPIAASQLVSMFNPFQAANFLYTLSPQQQHQMAMAAAAQSCASQTGVSSSAHVAR